MEFCRIVQSQTKHFTLNFLYLGQKSVCTARSWLVLQWLMKTLLLTCSASQLHDFTTECLKFTHGNWGPLCFQPVLLFKAQYVPMLVGMRVHIQHCRDFWTAHCFLPCTVVGHFVLQSDLLLPGVVRVLHEGGTVRLEVEL